MNDIAAEKIQKDDRRNILNPVILAALVVVLLCASAIGMGIRTPDFWVQIRDLIICTSVAALFLINILIIFLCVRTSIAIRQSRSAMKAGLSRADRTLDSISDEMNTLLQTVLEPVLGCRSWLSGIKQALLALRMKGKNES